MADRLTPPPAVDEIRAIPAEIHVLPAGALLWRIHFGAGTHPSRWNGFRSFGPTGARFDHQPPPPKRHRTRAILYASESGTTSLAEVFQQTRVIDRYASSMNANQPAFALYERARSSLPMTASLDLPLATPALAATLAAAAVHFGYALV